MGFAKYTVSVQQAVTSQGRLRKASWAAIFLLGEWLVWAWVHNVQRLLRYYTPVPYLDYWRTAMMLRPYQTFNYRVLWLQHNEHRVVCPEIVFAADTLLLHARQLLPIALGFVCYFGSWMALAWAFTSDAGVSRRVRTMGVLLAGVVLGWEGSAVVLINPFLLQWTLTTGAVILALGFVVRLKESGSNGYLSAVIVAAVIATYSSGNGMFVWPIVIAAAFLLSIGRRQILVIVRAGIVSIAIYFIGYQWTGTLSVMNLIRHPIYLLKFVASYMAMPFSAVTPYWLGSALGIAAMGVTAGLALVAGRARMVTTRTGIVLFGFYLYVVLTALLIAAGRMDPGQVGIGNAKYARYVIEPLIAWAVLVLLCVWLCSRLASGAVWVHAVLAAVGVLALIGFSRFGGWLGDRDAEYAQMQMAGLALQNDVLDEGVMLNPFPWNTGRAIAWSQALREQHLSVFHHGYRGWLGSSVGRFAHVSEEALAGEITYLYPVLDGIEVAGWVDTKSIAHWRGWLLLANERGQIVGFGRKLPAGFPPQLQNLRTPASLGWVGFVNLKYATTRIHAYAIEKNRLAPLEGSVSAPEKEVVEGQSIGPAITDLQWRMDKAWAPNRLPQDRSYGFAPQPPIYGTWGGEATAVGRIESSVFPAPSDGCLILPVLQGPHPGGLLAEIIDADTNQAVATVPVQNAAQQWAFWRMPLGSSVKHVRVVGVDSGREIEQWMELAAPRRCR